MKDFWRQRLALKPKEDQLQIDVKRDRDDLKQPLTPEEHANMTENEIKIRDYKVANFRRWLLEESSAIQQQKIRAK